MAGPRYLSETDCLIHALGDSAFTASPSSATGWDPKLVKNGSPSLGWRSGAALTAGGSPFFLIFDMGGAVTAPDFVAAMGLDLPTGATIDIVSDDAITLDTDAGNPQVIDNIANYADGDSHAYLSGLTTSVKRYWGYRINHGGTDGVVTIGEGFLGNSSQLTRQCRYDRGHSQRFGGITHVSSYGERWSYERSIVPIEKYTMVFKDQSNSGRDEMLAMHNTARGGGKVLAFAREPDSATAAISKVVEPVRLGDAMSWRDDLNLHDFDAIQVGVLPVQRVG
jgi:hypothetical protein